MHGTPYLSDVIAGVSTHLISIRRRDQQRRSRHAGLEISNYRAAAFTRPPAGLPSCVCTRAFTRGGAGAGQELERGTQRSKLAVVFRAVCVD